MSQIQAYLFCQQCNQPYGLPSNYSSQRVYRCCLCKNPLQVKQRTPTQSSVVTPFLGDQAGDMTHDPLFGASQAGASAIFGGDQLGPGSIITSTSGNRFQVMDLLGKGGSGRVYEVQDPFLKRSMALKMILESKSLHVVTKKRFFREIFITAKLEHPNIIPLYEAGYLQDGSLYILMKKIGGSTLKDLLVLREDGQRETPLRRMIELFLKACDAVSFAHSKEVIHRDLKPSNMAVGDFGELIVMDWGLAKFLGEKEELKGDVNLSDSMGEDLSLDGALMGTPAYMPPEQANGKVDLVGVRSDVYSLGAVLYHMLTLTTPFDGSPREIVTSLLMKDPLSPCMKRPSLKIPRALDAIAMKAMAKSVKNRYPSVTAIVKDIQNYLDERPVSVYTPPLKERVTKWISRHTAALGVAFFICILIALFGYLLALEGQRRLVQQKKTIKAQREKQRFYEDKLTAEKSASVEREKKLLAQKKQQEFLKEKLKAEEERRKAEEEKLKVKQEQEEYQKKLLKAYNPYLSARNQMAHNLRYSHLRKNVIPLLKKALAIQPKFLEARLELIKMYGYLNMRNEMAKELMGISQYFPKEKGNKLKEIFNGLLFSMALGGGQQKASLPDNIDDYRPEYLPPVYWSTLKIQVLMGLRQFDKVIAEADEMLKTPEGQGWETHYLKAVSYSWMGQKDRALELFTKLINQYPHIPYPYGNRALIYYYHKNKPKEAMMDLRKALRVDPSYFIAWNELGKIARKEAQDLMKRGERGSLYLERILKSLRYFQMALYLGSTTESSKQYLKEAFQILTVSFGFSKLDGSNLIALTNKLYDRVGHSNSRELRKEFSLFALLMLRNYWKTNKTLARYFMRFAREALEDLKKYQQQYPQSIDAVWIQSELKMFGGTKKHR